MSDPMRMTLSDQHPWVFICSIIYYGAFSHAFFSSNVLLLKSGTLSPMQRLKFWLPQYIFYIYICYFKLKASQHHYFIYFILKPNFTRTNMFLLYLCCVLLSFSVHFGRIRFYSAQFGLSCPLRFYSVHFGHILFYSVHFGLIQFNFVHFFHLGYVRSIMSTLVLFSSI